MYIVELLVYSIYDDDVNPFFVFEKFEEAADFLKIIIHNGRSAEIRYEDASELED